MNASVANLPAQRQGVLVSMASKYGMEAANFEQTLRATVFPKEASKEQFAAFLVVANQYGLNPLTKEIFAFPTRGGGVQPIVSVDGWVNLVNSHPAFDGLEFDDHGDGKSLTAITARIWRKDRSKPTVVTEYMAECHRDTDTWKKWPRRMLRHKAMIQCARYAFGFAGIVDPDEAERMGADVSPMRNFSPQNGHARDNGPPAPPKAIEHRAGPSGDQVVWDETGERPAANSDFAPIDDDVRNTFLNRTPSEFDSTQWRKDAEGALSGCEDSEGLFRVNKEVIQPAKGKAFPPDWQSVMAAYKHAFDRLSLGE